MSSETSHDAPSANQPGVIRRIFTFLYAAALVAAAMGLLFIWLLWEPDMGPAMQNVVTYAIVLLALLLTGGWLVFFSPFRWRTILGIFTATALMGTAAVAAVREVEFDGDMGLVVHYRWEPTPAERLAAHRRQLGEAPPDAEPSAFEVPRESDDDMAAYRGVNREGILTGPSLSQDWQTQPPRQLWQQPCGGGYSAFSVVGDFAVTLEQRGGYESVVCYDAATGVERWVQEYPAVFQETVGGPGPRATPTIDGTDVFSYGAEGDLICVELATGVLRWHRDLLIDGAKNVEWGLSSSPLVVDAMVIVEVGGPDGDGLTAVDRSTGETIWQRPGVERLTEPDLKNRAGYSSAMMATLDGVRQILIFDGEGLRSHVPETGDQLWFHEFKNNPGVNVAQPIVFEDGRVFLSQSYGVGCRMIAVTRTDGDWSTQTLWDNLHMKCKFTSPVLHEGSLYGLDEGILVCLDPETGERNWKKGRYGHGQVLLINGQLVIMGEKGDVVLVAADPDRWTEITRFGAINHPKVWNPHAVAGGIVYVRNHETMAAYDLRAE